MIKNGHSATRGREKSPITSSPFTHPASESRVPQRSTKCQHRGHTVPTSCWKPRDPPLAFAPHVPGPGVPPASQRGRNSPSADSSQDRAPPGGRGCSRAGCRLRPFSRGLAKANPAGRLLAAEQDWDGQLSPVTTDQREPRSHTDGATEAEPPPLAAPPHPPSPGQEQRLGAPRLQSPRLTQICLKGSGAAALSLQARLGRFQGTPSPRSKLAAKNETPLWQGDMLLVLAGGQGTSRALWEGGLDRSPDRGGCTQTCHPSDDKTLTHCCGCLHILLQAQP